MSKTNGATALSDPTTDGEATITASIPYRVSVTIEGTAPLLCHRWSVDAVAAKASAAKGSEAKKTDDVESYVWRDGENRICLPGEYLRGSLCNPQGAAKYLQDPRSPRKSALDLYRAGIVSLTELAPICTSDHPAGSTDWEYLDRRRVTVQRAGVTRVRPAFSAGWTATFVLMVLTPEYIGVADLRAVLYRAGVFVGVGDYRPTFGRFDVTNFEVLGD